MNIARLLIVTYSLSYVTKKVNEHVLYPLRPIVICLEV